jgi:hypothetical protein
MTAETRQLDDMREAAFGLGMAFAQAAEAEGELDRKLRLFDAFHRSFASVRLSIALAMRLRREALAPREIERPERDDWREAEGPESPEPLDAGAERYDERDRDREDERASLPLLFSSLEQVADDARALMPQAAELPTLTELLDRVRGAPGKASPPAPAPKAPSPAPPKPSGALRARLSGGTATLTLPPRPGLPGLGGASRATGPPPRR